MKKFLHICKGLQASRGITTVHRLKYENVLGYLRYLQYESNPNKFYPIEMVTYPDQVNPSGLLLIDVL